MMLDAELLQILRCPETHQILRVAEPDVVARLNERIAAGAAHNRQGNPVTTRVEGALVRADGKFLYLVRDGMPIMLVNEAVALPL